MRRRGTGGGLAAFLLLAGPASAEGWPEGPVLPFVAGLRACLATQPPGAFATTAATRPDGSVEVRLRRPDGGTALCRAAAGAPAAILPDAAAPPSPPDPAAPAFFLERRCVDARRLDGPDGSVLGWLAYPAC